MDVQKSWERRLPLLKETGTEATRRQQLTARLWDSHVEGNVAHLPPGGGVPVGLDSTKAHRAPPCDRALQAPGVFPGEMQAKHLDMNVHSCLPLIPQPGRSQTMAVCPLQGSGASEMHGCCCTGPLGQRQPQARRPGLGTRPV